MTTINIASKANQATTFPALLVSTNVNEADPKSQITINFGDVETLQSQKDATVEFLLDGSEPKYGSDQVIGSLLERYPVLQGKSQEQVCFLKIKTVGIDHY